MLRLVSCIETPEPSVYGTRIVPGQYQGASSELPGEDRSGLLLLLFQMLMLQQLPRGLDSEGRLQVGILLSCCRLAAAYTHRKCVRSILVFWGAVA